MASNHRLPGTTPDRARPDYQRPGSFKNGNKKRGGRKRGTPNLFSTDYKKAIMEAAYRIGYDGNGKDGVYGYFLWVGQRHPTIFYTELWISLLPLEEAETHTPKAPRLTRDELNESIRNYIGLKSGAKKPMVQDESKSPGDWTGQPFPVAGLMQLAVANPRGFCKLFVAAFLRPPTKRQAALRSRPPRGGVNADLTDLITGR
jgi:hypothetical protein